MRMSNESSIYKFWRSIGWTGSTLINGQDQLWGWVKSSQMGKVSFPSGDGNRRLVKLSGEKLRKWKSEVELEMKIKMEIELINIHLLVHSKFDN